MYREKLRAYTKAARLEYSIAEAPGVIIPVFIAVILIGRIELLRTAEAVTAFLLLYLSGFLVNSLTDLEVDEKYKSYVAEGVKSLGRGTLIVLLLVHLILALLLTIHLSYQLQSLLPLLFYAVGVFFGIGYSVEPLHFKVRGPLHPVALITSAFFIPFLFLVYTITGELPFLLLPMGIGFSLLHYGIALTNQAQDLIEDREAGMTTPAVRWGLGRTLRYALLLFGAGFVILLSGIHFLIGTLHLDPGAELFLTLTAVVLLLVGYIVPLRGMADLYRISLRSKPLMEKIRLIKRRLSYPRWQASGLYSLLLTVMLVALAGTVLPQEQPFQFSESPNIPQEVVYEEGAIRSAVLGEAYQDSNGTYLQPVVISLDIEADEAGYFILTVSRSGRETFSTLLSRVNSPEMAIEIPVERPGISDINITLLKGMRPVAYYSIPATKTVYISSPLLTVENLTLPSRAEYVLSLKVYNHGDEPLEKGALVVKALFMENSLPSELKISVNNATLQPRGSWDVSLVHQGSRGSSVTVDIELLYKGVRVDDISL